MLPYRCYVRESSKRSKYAPILPSTFRAFGALAPEAASFVKHLSKLSRDSPSQSIPSPPILLLYLFFSRSATLTSSLEV